MKKYLGLRAGNACLDRNTNRRVELAREYGRVGSEKLLGRAPFTAGGPPNAKDFAILDIVMCAPS